jgi:hypothetical protein
MSNASNEILQKEVERARGRLHAFVKGDLNLLLNEETYKLSTELDRLIVNLMRNSKTEKMQ